MGRFNLLDESWISVIVNENGSTQKVSMLEFFSNAHTYYGLAGETKTQDFAMYRFLLAVVHTVFSRFDQGGNPYDQIELGTRFDSTNTIEDEDELDDYYDAMFATWGELWKKQAFPPIINEYLEKWRDRFYLFDDEYPFFQVKKEDIAADKISRANASVVNGKNINRLISESANKIALFSPRYGRDDNKEILTADEVARWLLTYHGYTGLSDKVIFGSDKYKASKGWLFDIGGILLKGKNVFETLLLNLVLVHPEESWNNCPQTPCWELAPSEMIDQLLSNSTPNNLAALYTNWSRAIYIDPEIDLEQPFEFQIVKVPEINHQNFFLEPMTLWRCNDSGPNKGCFTPRKHNFSQSIWRSFGLLTISSTSEDNKTNTQKPIIMDWLGMIKETIGDTQLSVEAISMEDDGNATSWVPVNEIYDCLAINDELLVNDEWTAYIDNVVELTKTIVNDTFRRFVWNVGAIRGFAKDKNTPFTYRHVEKLYFLIDESFREWLFSIHPTDSREEKTKEWKKELKYWCMQAAEEIVKSASSRDYTGISVEKKGGVEIKNIAVVHQDFLYFLNERLK